jgi:hypothetical protein
MPVAFPLLLRLMANPFVDQPLIGPLAGTQRNEAVPETVPAGHDRPPAPGQRPLEVIVSLFFG